LVVRDGATYSTTTRLTLTAAEVRRLDRVRAHIEAGIRVCTDQRALTGGPARSERAQPHFVCWSGNDNLSIYTLKRVLSCKGRSCVLPALER
jgi:uncharacterized protein with LGFP repeats